MTDICDHCGKPIKNPVYITGPGGTRKFGRKCAKMIKQYEPSPPREENPYSLTFHGRRPPLHGSS